MLHRRGFAEEKLSPQGMDGFNITRGFKGLSGSYVRGKLDVVEREKPP